MFNEDNGKRLLISSTKRLIFLNSFGVKDNVRFDISLLVEVDRLWKFTYKLCLEINSIIWLISEVFIPHIDIVILFAWLCLYVNFLFIKIHKDVNKKPITATWYWSEPVASPIPIQRKIYVSSSGSFIGVLNLTIESAPTSPKESAKEDFTTAIIIVVPTLNIGKMPARVAGLEKLFE